MKMESENNNNKKKGSVEVHSLLTVVSSTPVKPGTTCQLSPLDHAMAHHTLHVIFYYRSGSLDFSSIRPALNEVLTRYPNVTGRLAKDDDGKWQVRCTDAGVRVLLGKVVGRSVDEWLRSASADDERDLTAWEDLPHDDPSFWSPFRIQVTDFEGGGTAIGVSCLHMLGDPTSVTLLIKSWTEAHHRETLAHPPFLHHLTLPNPITTTTNTTTTSATYDAAKSTRSNPPPLRNMASATFSFSSSAIKQALSNIRSAIPEASPFDLLTALFWTRIAGLKSWTVDSNSSQSISICMDMRNRLKAPLPFGYFGNALHFSRLTVDANELEGGDHLGHVAGLVHRHVAGVKEEDFWSTLVHPPIWMYGPELTCINMDHMIVPSAGNESQPLMYMARFEKDQKPAHVSYHVRNSVEGGEGLIWVMPSPEEGVLARRVTVTLPEEEMRKLLEDEVILSLQPNLLLSGRS